MNGTHATWIGPGGYGIANIISFLAWVRHGWLLAIMMPCVVLFLVWMVLEGCLGSIFENLLHEDYFAGIDVMGEVFVCASSNGRLVR